MSQSTGKTRTSSAHAPVSSKKVYKSSSTSASTSKSAATTAAATAKGTKKSSSKPTATTTKPRSAFAAVTSSATVFTHKRKAPAADEGEAGTGTNKEEPEKRHVMSTLLNAPEEIDFPRGGGTTLTQVEVREAQLEGEKEARDEDESERLTNTEVVKDKSKSKRRKLERELATAIKPKNVLPKDAFRVEHLNYKRLVPTTKVLAQIITIRPLELIVSLPNQLLGHIPITAISSEYTERLEIEGEESSEEEDVSEDEALSEAGSSRQKGGLPGLMDLFKVGDWVSAIVVNSKVSDSKAKLGGRTGDENVRAARRIELSLEPEKVNEGIAKGDLRTGFTLTSAVKSIEDHGYILSLGLPSITAFVSFKEAKKLQPTRLDIGAIVACRVKEVGENGRTCTVTVGRAEVIGSTLGAATSIASVLPGCLVTALVTATLSSGLNVKFFGYFDGTIDLFHLNNLDPETDFKVGQKIKARVIWDSIGSTPKKFSLSLAKHVLSMTVAQMEGKKEEEIAERFKIGMILDQVQVVRMDDEWGLTCEILEGGLKTPAFVHISRITDDHLATVPKAGPWRLGTIHKGRVIGYSAVDGLVQLTFQPSVIEQSFLRVSDVQVGEVVKGTVKKLTDSALFVSISGNVDGVVWPVHYADIKLKHPEKKFKVGAVVKARIYSADAEKNRVVLTLKRDLVTSELPIIATFSDAKVGVVTHGTVSKILDAGILVDFFGGLRGLVPSKEAAEGYTAELSLLFAIGKVIPVRIIAVDQERQRIVASARQAASAFNRTTTAGLDAVEIGNVLSGEITGLHETNVIFSLQPSTVKALMSYTTLSRHRKITVDELKLELAKGQIVEDLVVVSKRADKGFVIVGLVPTKVVPTVPVTTATLNGAAAVAPITFESLVAGQLVSGRICGKIPTGILVQLARNVKGRIPPTEVSDDYDALNTPGMATGAHVDCIVLRVDAESRKVELSLRGSRMAKDATVVEIKDRLIETVDDLVIGEKVRGFVKNIASQGLFVSLGGTVTARVQIKELFDEFIKEWQPKFSVEQLVEGKIIAVNKISNQVEMSLKKSASVQPAQKAVPTFVAGQVVNGTVTRVETYGAFIRLEGSNVSGLCHKSNVTDDESVAWTQKIHGGEQVKVFVISVNAETKKIALGVKASLFVDAQDDDEEGEDEEDDDEEAEEEDQDEEENDDTFMTAEADSDAEIEVPQASTSKVPIATAPLAVAGGFDWDGNDSDEETQGQVDPEDDEEEEEQIDAPIASATPAAPKDRNIGKVAPTTMADFERLLLGSPNSSYLWIQYIAYYLGLSQVDKARTMSRRALKAINYREEGEKLNVWVAMMNLENSYGTEAELEELFKEASQSNDAKTVYLRLVDIYERSGKYDAEEELFQRLVKKFGQSSKAWTLFGQYYLTRGKPNEARELLPRSLKSLEKRKHVKTISKFAQLEFKLGDAERGRTIFEGIMDSYSKRLDLWFVYVDMEIKQNNTAAVRALFDRILAQTLSSKKGKSVFKKWLAFEKEHGDAAGVEKVKTRARAFVESRQEGQVM